MFLFEGEPAPTLFTAFNFMLALIAFIVLVATSIIVILARRGDVTSKVQKDRADAGEGLLKIRDTELADCRTKCGECQEELEDVTAELRGQLALDIHTLMDYWQIRDRELAETASLKQENRVLKIRLGEPG